jgi:transcriptional regulator with XRE-family HTH domain
MVLGSICLYSVDMDTDRDYQGQLVEAIDAELGVRRWSRRRLARESGINAQTLDRVFLLQRDMNIQQLDQIATALGVTPEYLVEKAREWRGGISHVSRPAPAVVVVTDPRSLIAQLLDEPDTDGELVRRLGEAAGLTGVSPARLKRLQDEIRLVRQGELQRALDALPTTAEQRHAN